MDDRTHDNQGLKRMVRRCRHVFRRKENTDYYADDDFQAAEHKFIKVCLLGEIALDK